MFDGDKLAEQMVEIVRGYMEAELKPLHAEIQAAKEVNAELARLIAERNSEPPERGERGELGPQGEPGPAGAVDMEVVRQMVEAAVAALPPAERGERGEPGQDGLPGERGADGIRGEPGRDGKDGAGLANALKDADGNLILVMTDGGTKNLGKINGEDGRDGLGFDDLSVEQVDDRSVNFVLQRGADKAEFEVTFPVPLDRGVWAEDGAYTKGDGVTWAGSFWIAQRDAPGKPDTADGGWRLAVKRGRDGKGAPK